VGAISSTDEDDMPFDTARLRRRANGVHYTPSSIFVEHVLPDLLYDLWRYCWVDLYCGDGSLIFPIVERIPAPRRPRFFEGHVRMFDIDADSVERCVARAVSLGVPEALARRNISQLDTLAAFPEIRSEHEVFHVTNPPYLYIGYIRKHAETRGHLRYFEGENSGLQDLYQVALANDIRRGTKRMVYIIPANFLFGDSASNRIREMLFPLYRLRRAVLFEDRIFEETGTNVAACFFERKASADLLPQSIELTRVGRATGMCGGGVAGSPPASEAIEVSPEGRWRAGGQFSAIVGGMPKNALGVRFYLLMSEVESSPGGCSVSLIDSSSYSPSSSSYRRVDATVSAALARRIQQNDIWVRTIDTGSEHGLAGFYSVKESFCADGIVVGSNFTYRTSPIQVFLDPPLPPGDLEFVRVWANYLLRYLRGQLGSNFMTTYKYSTSSYTRKYLGLKQARSLLMACPVWLSGGGRRAVIDAIRERRYREAFGF